MKEAFMLRAIELAREGMQEGTGGPFGAVVVKKDSIVGEGWNRVLSEQDPTAHGEIMAIRDACHRLGSFHLDGCEIYTTGEPCPMCLGAIYWARIERIYFGFSILDAARVGFDDVHFHHELQKPTAQRRIPSAQLCESAALQLLANYEAIPNRKSY